MVLIKSKPEQLLNPTAIPQTFSSLMNSFFDEPGQLSGKLHFTPGTDIIEHSNAYEIRMSLPGMKKEDIKIALEGDKLNVSGERQKNITEENSRFVKREIAYGSFSRTFTLGKADSSKIEARFEDGLLFISIPKKTEDKQSLIPVK